MTPFASELVSLARHFGMLERESVCCGTVTVPQCVALQFLLEGERDVSELAGHMGVSLSAVTRLVDGMEKREWTTRGRAPDDRRRVVVQLTRSGKKEATRLAALTQASIESLLAEIPKAKHKSVLESLGLLRTALERVREDGSCC